MLQNGKSVYEKLKKNISSQTIVYDTITKISKMINYTNYELKSNNSNVKKIYFHII